MSDSVAHPPATAFFLDGQAGPLFALHRPSRCVMSRGGVVVVPPFAEELNKSRRMLSLQAQALATEGFDVLTVDLYGTGDSAGDFEQAGWSIWVQDILAAVAWLRARGLSRLALLGVRFGALLAAAAAAAMHETQLDRVVLWQPVTNGEMMMTQFLRTRVAAERMGASENQVSTNALREAIRRDESVEIAGYRLAPALLRALDDLRLEPMAGADSPPIDWMEVVTQAGQSISPAGRRVTEAWRKAGVRVDTTAVSGQSFWATAEITTAPNLLEATTHRFVEHGAT